MSNFDLSFFAFSRYYISEIYFAAASGSKKEYAAAIFLIKGMNKYE